jgi:hypothetical protein
MKKVWSRTTSMGPALLALGLLVVACDDSTSPTNPRLSILLTDAPGAVEEAWVEITGIYLQGTPSAPGEKMWLLQETTGLIDLITLDEQTLALVEGAVIDPGVFSQLRFIVGEAAIVVRESETEVKVYATDGLGLEDLNAARQAFDAGLSPLSAIDGELQCPSCSETGFKVGWPGGAIRLEDEAEILVVDFDAQQSFGRLAGTSGQWVMEPLLSATELGLSGSIVGTVSWADTDPQLSCGDGTVTLADFRPTATSGEVIKTGTPTEDGSYRISFVAPGTWTMGFESLTFDNGDVLTFEATHPESVEVTSGSVATADFSITSAACN